MSNNYSKFFNNNVPIIKDNSEEENVVATETLHEDANVNNEVNLSENEVTLNVEDNKEIVQEPKRVSAEITCERLYVRSLPNISSDPVCIIDKDWSLRVILDGEDHGDFYRVVVTKGDGREDEYGYCMKKFVTIE